MEFTVSRNALLAALNRAKCVINTKYANDLFKYIVFTFSDEVEVKSITVHVSDSKQWYSETIPVIFLPVSADAQEPVRSFSVWYYGFIRAIRSLDEQPLTFRVGEMQMSIHHECGSFRLPLGDQTGEFLAITRPCPDADAADGFSMEYEAPVLRSILTKCSYAMADDELRPVMNGVCMNLTKDFSDYVSSEGHKLVRVRRQAVAIGGKGDRLSIFANQSSEMLTLNIKDDNLRITADDYDFATDGEENLPCEYKGNGMQAYPLRIGMKAPTLAATLKHLSTEEVIFQFTDSTSAVLILPKPQPDVEEVTMLMMPMLVND